MLHSDFDIAKHNYNLLINKNTGEFYARTRRNVKFPYGHNIMLDDCKSSDEVALKVGTAFINMFNLKEKENPDEIVLFENLLITSESTDEYNADLQIVLETLVKAPNQDELRKREEKQIAKDEAMAKQREELAKRRKEREQEEEYKLYVQLKAKYGKYVKK